MAMDEVLLQQANAPLLRIYRWQAPSISFGYFGKFTDVQATARGREAVRRWTGGGIVEHGADLTYTLIVPRAAPFFGFHTLESYRLIHEHIARWLTTRGIVSQVAPQSAEVPSSACFTTHVRYDLVDRSTKIAGAAQRRTRWGLLHQGSVQSPLADHAGFAETFAQQIATLPVTNELAQAAEHLAAQKYATADWLEKF